MTSSPSVSPPAHQAHHWLCLGRSTCENVVRVLRANKDSVMAMLEAFVHDPLINWRLLNTGDTTAEPLADGDFSHLDVTGISCLGQA